ncbi:hypothetical protein B0H14DRAFT_2522209, partial [Mycena olivaceomarginata]
MSTEDIESQRTLLSSGTHGTFPGRGKFHDLAEAFRPERFLLNDKLNPAIRDSETVAFGFGRR